MFDEFRDTEKNVQVKLIPPLEFIVLALSLPVGKLEALFGPVPTLSTIDGLTFSALQPVLTVVARQDPGADPPIAEPSRDKLQWNRLSEAAADYLRLGRRREKLVEEYFSRYPEPEYGEQIAEGFRPKYAALREPGYHSADEIFGELWRYAGGASLENSVRPDGAVHQWRKDPPR